MLGNMLTKDEVEDFMREADVVRFTILFPGFYYHLSFLRMETENLTMMNLSK